jgi:SAM-dependent methyltransferase
VSTGAVDYDAELIRFGELLRRAWAVRPDDRVLDIGCGAGSTTREAARLAPAGSALGIDMASVDLARERARAEGVSNVDFYRADAQAYDFEPGSFDLAVSRFGTMFFTDPVAAFGNVGRALRPGGRLVMLVWQAHDENQWDVVIHRALAEPDDAPLAFDHRPDPFSLADPAVVNEILGAAGFTAVEFIDVREPVYYGQDTSAALDWVSGFGCARSRLNQPDRAAAERARTRLTDALAAHETADGVWFAARTWIVTARR